MASSSGSGTCSGSISGLQNSGSEQELQQLMDHERKRKRMISNRESARRSRMRKQKHLDELMTQVAELRKENNQIITSMNATTQQYLNVEAENAVLRAQMGELSHRLHSLNEIIEFLNAAASCTAGGDTLAAAAAQEPYGFADQSADGFLNNNSCWNHPLYLNQPLITASANMLHY